jgi:outer membrane protein assembly factor BamB
LIVGSVASTAGQGFPHDYPQWRGRNRDGAASAFATPASWPERLTLRWRAEVGEGYATPLVVGTTVYAFTRQDGREGVTALHADTGTTIWRTDSPVAFEPYEGAEDHGKGPKATPLFQDGTLYTLGVAGTISAVDARTGTLLWQKPAPLIEPDVGMASSPIADGGLVIVQEGYDALTAFEAATGRVRWTVKHEFRYASPIVVELHGTRQLVVAAQHAVLGIAVADGAVLWSHPWTSPYIQAVTPVLYRDTIIVSGQQRGVLALKPVRRDAAWGVEVVWHTEDASLFLSSPVVIGDTLFGLSHRNSGQYFALDAATGRILWLDRPRRAVNTAIAKAGDVLFLLNDDAELIVARGSRTRFEPVAHYTVAESATWAQPAISGTRILVKDVSSLASWSLD